MMHKYFAAAFLMLTALTGVVFIWQWAGGADYEYLDGGIVVLDRIDPAAALVIPEPDASAEQIHQMHEDMIVMSRIIDRKFPRLVRLRDLNVPAAGNLLVTTNIQTQGLFIQGYGVIFLVTVDFPLAEPAPVPEHRLPRDETLWGRTRREFYMRPDEREFDYLADYDPARVEQLTHEMIENLRHAHNIRHLDSDDRVIVALYHARTPIRTVDEIVDQFRERYRDQPSRDRPAVIVPTGHRQPVSALAISARKSDVDHFYNSRITLDEFAESVEIIKF